MGPALFSFPTETTTLSYYYYYHYYYHHYYDYDYYDYYYHHNHHYYYYDDHLVLAVRRIAQLDRVARGRGGDLADAREERARPAGPALAHGARLARRDLQRWRRLCARWRRRQRRWAGTRARPQPPCGV